ncbi:leucine-rich repeat domain-containing protein [Flavobacterium nackdongense]|uniref:Leucine-rich repeat domain-containing protein n=1 Tax=Flavobacterium nackdongense TaxID=2547394 RepID=A0A4P6Y738_9FLAO|nr:leucine-rich repeat domain-containing protein [Flavobacterium nackdongense]QBN18371.1 leucine-rich repeat domain-containing protein [Flavobacterium nackdongense]
MKSIISIFLLVMTSQIVTCQTKTNSKTKHKEYTSIEEALKNPEKVYNLNLSNQNNVVVPKEAWAKFTNLETLSFRNDHLKEIPQEIGDLPNLKVLDLSGNDFTVLPQSLRKLNHLEELYLNEEKNLFLNPNSTALNLPLNLKILHLENDALKNLPKEIYELKKLEQLFLNDNNFIQIPKEMNSLKNLKQLDFHNNKIPQQLQQQQEALLLNQNFGFKIIF